MSHKKKLKKKRRINVINIAKKKKKKQCNGVGPFPSSILSSDQIVRLYNALKMAAQLVYEPVVSSFEVRAAIILNISVVFEIVLSGVSMVFFKFYDWFQFIHVQL